MHLLEIAAVLAIGAVVVVLYAVIFSVSAHSARWLNRRRPHLAAAIALIIAFLAVALFFGRKMDCAEDRFGISYGTRC